MRSECRRCSSPKFVGLQMEMVGMEWNETKQVLHLDCSKLGMAEDKIDHFGIEFLRNAGL